MTTIQVLGYTPDGGINVQREYKILHGVAFGDTLDACGSLDDAKEELKRDAPQMAEMVSRMFVEYPANLDGAELGKLKTEIRELCGPIVTLEFKKSKWIHTAGGWVEQP